jgi:inosose dehydratase
MIDASSKSKRIRLGCQTNAWPINPSDPETLFIALKDIHELGFEGFETGFRNLPLLTADRDGLTRTQPSLILFGIHIFLHEYDAETRLAPLKLVLEVASAAAEIGVERLILSGAPTPVHNGALTAKLDALNNIAARIKSFGLQLAYHNHGPEVTGPQPEIETLFEATDPQLVSFLLDAGHTFRAGLNVPEFVARYAGRLAGLHLRDFKAGAQVPLGEGEFPLQEVAGVLKENDWSGWILAEEEREDGSKPGLSAATTARRALKQAFGV